MKIVLQYFDDCPNWQLADERLALALAQIGRPDAVVEYEVIDTVEKAELHGFHGSPTFQFDGADPFDDGKMLVALTCRRYVTETGMQGAPTVQQLVDALGGPAREKRYGRRALDSL